MCTAASRAGAVIDLSLHGGHRLARRCKRLDHRAKRRERARKRGLDPDTLGLRYMLPARHPGDDLRMYHELMRAGERARLLPED
jgi:hypothetical protein